MHVQIGHASTTVDGHVRLRMEGQKKFSGKGLTTQESFVCPIEYTVTSSSLSHVQTSSLIQYRGQTWPVFYVLTYARSLYFLF